MAISYPLNLPTSIGIGQITLRAVNTTVVSESIFTFKQQVISFPGERWEANVSIPQQRREFIAPWKAFLVALKGNEGTFLLGDPDYTTPQGTVSSCSISGAAGARSVTATMSGSLLAGDYIQVGSGSSARLHQVLEDRVGSGTMEIWPALRSAHSGSVIFNNAKGVFRLASPSSSWSIGNNSGYNISFDCVEAL